MINNHELKHLRETSPSVAEDYERLNSLSDNMTDFAKALGKDVIVTVKKGTELPFDLRDIPTVFWEIQEDLKDGLQNASLVC